MKSKVSEGCSLNYVNPSSSDTIASDAVVDVGFGVGVAVADILPDETGVVAIEGVFEKAAKTSQAWSQGDVLYWDSNPGEFTKTATGNKRAGYAAEAKESAAATGLVKLLPGIDDDPGQLNVAAVVTYSAGSNLSGVDGTGSNAAPLAGTETRLDALDTAVAAILTSLKNAGLMASS